MNNLITIKEFSLPIIPAEAGIQEWFIISSISHMSRWLLTAALLLVCLGLPCSALAEYRITTKGKTIETACYWIENARVYLCEGGEPIPLADVSTISTGQFSPLEEEINRDAVRRLYAYQSWLLGMETELLTLDESNQGDLQKYFDLNNASPRNKDERLRMKKQGLKEIQDLMPKVISLQSFWSGIRVPDRSLVQPSEIKSLQLLAWILSLDERRMYLNTNDPTYRELAVEHMKQTVTFQMIFSRVMDKLNGL